MVFLNFNLYHSYIAETPVDDPVDRKGTNTMYHTHTQMDAKPLSQIITAVSCSMARLKHTRSCRR